MKAVTLATEIQLMETVTDLRALCFDIQVFILGQSPFAELGNDCAGRARTPTLPL